jgi:hypothetical protein
MHTPLKDSSIKPLFNYAFCGLVTEIELTIGHPLCKMKWITIKLYYLNMDFDLINVKGVGIMHEHIGHLGMCTLDSLTQCT